MCDSGLAVGVRETDFGDVHDPKYFHGVSQTTLVRTNSSLYPPGILLLCSRRDLE